MSLALIFPGQGSQSVGMAADLAARFPVARDTLREADEVLGFPLSSLMAGGPDEELRATVNAQPALLTHSVAALRVLGERAESAAVTAGHSLGEFSAHVAAGTLTFEDALRAVRLRGERMYEAGLSRPGTMAALLGLEADMVAEVCGRVTAGICVPANFNSSGQVVVSGDLAGIDEALELATEAGAKKALKLNVSGGFHSPLMQPAAEELADHLASVDFADPRIPIVANATVELVRTGARARELLIEQLTAPVRWQETIGVMVDSGVDHFYEVGPGKVLTGLNKRNAKGVATTPLGDPDHFDGLEAAV